MSQEVYDSLSDTVQDHVEAKKGKKQDMSAEMKFLIEYNFHAANLKQIKKNLKGRCSFIAHVQEPKYVNGVKSTRHLIKAIMKNEVGGKDTVLFQLGSTPDKMTEKDYEELYFQLSTKDYVARGSQEGV